MTVIRTIWYKNMVDRVGYCERGKRKGDMKPARVETDGFKYHIQVVKEEILQIV